MARVNLWLRGARGKFAGSSLSKGANGETIAREVVTPSNPNTVKQRYQRAIMATIMIMYSAFSELFDHAFQGKAKGSACQQEFMKRNIRNLRNLLIEDMQAYNDTENPVNYQLLRHTVVVPKSSWPSPNPYIISEGTYQQRFFSLSPKALYDGSTQSALAITAPAALSEAETIAEYANRNGLIPGDIYTLLALVTPYTNTRAAEWVAGKDPSGLAGGSGRWGAASIKTVPTWIRLQVKSDVLDNTAVNPSLSALFDVTEVSDPEEVLADFVNTDAVGTNKFFTKVTGGAGTLAVALPVCAGVIRSRFDQDLRSTTVMTLYNEFAAGASAANANTVVTGITAPCIPNTWEDTTGALGDSELLLESSFVRA